MQHRIISITIFYNQRSTRNVILYEILKVSCCFQFIKIQIICINKHSFRIDQDRCTTPANSWLIALSRIHFMSVIKISKHVCLSFCVPPYFGIDVIFENIPIWHFGRITLVTCATYIYMSKQSILSYPWKRKKIFWHIQYRCCFHIDAH